MSYLPRSVRQLALAGASLLMLGGVCSPEPQPCQTVFLSMAPTSVSGTLSADGTTFDLPTTCKVSLAYSHTIADSTPTTERFSQRGTQFVVQCGQQPEHRVSTGALFPGAPFDVPPKETRLAVETIDGSFCRMVSDATLNVAFTVKAGEIWPDGNTPVSDDFERTFTLDLDVTPPHIAVSHTDLKNPLCAATESIALKLSATFTIRAQDIEHESGLTCLDGMPQ